MTGAAAGVMTGLATAFTVDVSPDAVSAYGSSGAAANLTTSSAVATPAGGVAPFTYSWAQVGTSGYTWIANSPAAASSTFTATSVDAGAVAEATFRVTVTDSVGAKATADVEVFANNGQPYDPRQSFFSLKNQQASN